MLRILVAFAALGSHPPVVLGQTSLAVEVRVSRITMRGDTARVEYAVTNDPGSEEDLWEFSVEAPSRVIRIEHPSPAENWDTSTIYKTLSVASWATLGTHVRPGSTTPPLAFEAIGLPGLVTYWAMGWFPVPKYEAELHQPPPMTPREAIAESSIEGRTVGIDPLPADRSPRELLRRLQGLLDASCGGLAWIRSAALCRGLRARLQQASQSLSAGKNAAPGAQLQRVLQALAHHKASDVRSLNSAAFWLLTANVEYVLRRIRLH